MNESFNRVLRQVGSVLLLDSSHLHIWNRKKKKKKINLLYSSWNIHGDDMSLSNPSIRCQKYGKDHGWICRFRSKTLSDNKLTTNIPSMLPYDFFFLLFSSSYLIILLYPYFLTPIFPLTFLNPHSQNKK